MTSKNVPFGAMQAARGLKALAAAGARDTPGFDGDMSIPSAK